MELKIQNEAISSGAGLVCGCRADARAAFSEFLFFASFGHFKETGFAHLPSSAVKKLVCVCVRRRFGMFLVEVSLGMFNKVSRHQQV
jgi:hypothetical protein